MFASFPDADPVEIGAAVTIDADFFIEPDDPATRSALADEFGEDNPHHLAHGYYADFVDLRLAEAFPKGWRERLVPMPGFANVVALHPMDMAVSKVNATARSRLDRRFGRREADRGLKDILTLVTLIRAGHIVARELVQRGGSPTVLDRIMAYKFATAAIDALDAGQTNAIMVYRDGTYGHLPIQAVAGAKYKLDPALIRLAGPLAR